VGVVRDDIHINENERENVKFDRGKGAQERCERQRSANEYNAKNKKSEYVLRK